ncbi:ABC transporter permease [Paenibacillus cisolokensis]|uniref:ABC transporter permease n=1 Tax=Paenibacillus cisolokensis TaxID=1658519 RepID=UPI003D2862E6
MTFRSLALSNMRGNWRSYGAFFLSSVFSVFIFYLYAAFIYHPEVRNGQIASAENVSKMMIVCEYLIGVFSFFFILYANSALLKTRKKEFGLLALFGMTRWQLRRLIFYENAAMAAVSAGVGIGLGILFSKLFFMALSVLLGTKAAIRFHVPPEAVWLSASGFMLLFMAITALSLVRIGRTEIAGLLKEARMPKPEPFFSGWLVALAAVCLGSGYGLAVAADEHTVGVLILPVTGLVTIGTYFLFTQCSVALIRFLQKRKRLYYDRTNMIVVSQLAYKLKDNARILFLNAILGAVVLTAASTVCVILGMNRDSLLYGTPYTIGYYEVGETSRLVADPEMIRQMIGQDGRQLAYEARAVAVPIHLDRYELRNGGAITLQSAAVAISGTDYNRLARTLGRETIALSQGESYLILPYYMNWYTPEKVTGTADGRTFHYAVAGFSHRPVLPPIGPFTYTLVVRDEQYAQWLAATPQHERLAAYGFEIKDWKTAGETVDKIRQSIPEQYRTKQTMTSRVDDYAQMRQQTGQALLVGVFICAVFFIASGSLIYFKLFTELQDDLATFRALTRIGMTIGEIRRIAVTQIGIQFLVPGLVGAVHTSFAMIPLGKIMHIDALRYAAAILLIYFTLQAIYFAVTSRNYMRSIRRKLPV